MMIVRLNRRFLPVSVAVLVAPLIPIGLAGQTRAEGDSSALEPVVVVADAGAAGFGLRSSDGAFSLRFRGVAQYDGRVFMVTLRISMRVGSTFDG